MNLPKFNRKSDRLTPLLQRLATARQIDPAAILGNERAQHIVDARQVFHYVLVKVYQMPAALVAERCATGRSGIIRNAQRVADLLSVKDATAVALLKDCGIPQP